MPFQKFDIKIFIRKIWFYRLDKIDEIDFIKEILTYRR